jgi:2,3-bisphosphoglycerate-independent phosphoglycerate mutase
VNELPARILFVFLDGVGVGAADPRTNAFACARLPHLHNLLGGCLPVREHLPDGGRLESERAVLVAADATLGVPGRPQSGTGQTSLLTGRNAAELFGRHFGSWVPTTLRPMLMRENLLARTVHAGRGAAFANAHPPGFGVERRPSAPALAASAAGLLTRGVAELAAGNAVASSITNERWRAAVGDGAVPDIDAAQAGRTLVRLAMEVELTLFAHYDTDFVGHRGALDEAVAALERVDAFLGGVLDTLPADTLLLIASDHGNVEDTSTGHTLNPVPVIAVGPGRQQVAKQVRAITDVAPVVRELFALNEQEPNEPDEADADWAQ